MYISHCVFFTIWQSQISCSVYTRKINDKSSIFDLLYIICFKLCGLEAQTLAMSVLKVMTTVLTGSGNAKERFKLRVGYGRFVEVLKSLGQPSMDLLKSVLHLVGCCFFICKSFQDYSRIQYFQTPEHSFYIKLNKNS